MPTCYVNSIPLQKENIIVYTSLHPSTNPPRLPNSHNVIFSTSASLSQSHSHPLVPKSNQTTHFLTNSWKIYNINKNMANQILLNEFS